MAMSLDPEYCRGMKSHTPISKRQQSVPQSNPAILRSVETENNCVLCPDELARIAYTTYVNEGRPEGRDVHHWLSAEARLIEERNLSRVDGSQNRL